MRRAARGLGVDDGGDQTGRSRIGQQLLVAVDDDARSRRAARHEPPLAGTRDPRPLLPAAAETVAGAVFLAATVAFFADVPAVAFFADVPAVAFFADVPAVAFFADVVAVTFVGGRGLGRRLLGRGLRCRWSSVAAVFVAAGALVALFRAAVFFAAGAVTLVAGLAAAAGVPVRRASSCAAAAALTASPEACSAGVGALTMAALLRPFSLRATRRDCLRASSIEGASPSAMASEEVIDRRAPTLDSPRVRDSA